jgi:thiol-disulfide isomerase/thioredoxin
MLSYLVLVFTGHSLALGAVNESAPSSRLHVVLLNGGGRPNINYYSHLQHVKQFTAVLQKAGIASQNITVFNADGAEPQADFAVRDPQVEPSFWLLEGTQLEQPLRPQIRFENSTVKGVTLQPATRKALQHWFAHAASRFSAGDTLLFYVTDHGTKNADDLTNNRIILWGENESLSVSELREMLARFEPQIRVVVLMSQCFSGSFANLMYNESNSQLPTGRTCGFFSSTADREAYGCYPENRDKDNVGHSFAFIEQLAAGLSLPEAHRRVLVADQTPDVPLKTSDVYLERLLEDEARARGKKVDSLIDELLAQAWLDKSAWEEDIRLLDRIAQAFGYFSPRSIAELQEQAQFLPNISAQFATYGKAWDAALHALTSENLTRFLSLNRDWQSRLDAKVLAELPATERPSLTNAFLVDLTAFTAHDTQTRSRLHLLQERAASAERAHYRMQVRLAVVLRLRSILTSIAGRMYLLQDELATQRKSYDDLKACEAFSLDNSSDIVVTPSDPEPFPAYDGERQLAERILPGWLGISFKPTSSALRDKLDLKAGASMVQVIYPDSPAKQAGLQVGDIIVGPPDAPFVEPQQIREWVMTAPIGTPATLHVLRGENSLDEIIVPQRYPLTWPLLPGPPKVGNQMPRLLDLKPYRGTLPVELGRGGPYVLFFWATWCGPCKASLPELVAFERESGTPVIAITDESPEQLDSFFKKYEGPFPAIVATDELRKSFLAYGVSGTPTFVQADVTGKVQSRASGYSIEKGLPLVR